MAQAFRTCSGLRIQLPNATHSVLPNTSAFSAAFSSSYSMYACGSDGWCRTVCRHTALFSLVSGAQAVQCGQGQ